MATHHAIVSWERGDQAFLDNRYRRAHVWRFDEGIEVPASSSPGVVPVPLSDPAAVDPEEAFVASLSSCHMLWFLSIAAKRKFVVDRYTDHAEGAVARNAEGKLAVVTVTLRPDVVFSGDRAPTSEELDHMHHQAHEQCFIANSVKTQVRVESVLPSKNGFE